MICKIVGLSDIDLKSLGSIFDVDVGNSGIFCQVTMSRSYISRKQLFGRIWILLTHNLQTRRAFSVDFFASL